MPSELSMRIAANDDLRQENERLKSDIKNAWEEVAARGSDNAALRQQVAALRADSERYVELRDGESRFAVADYGDIREGCALVGGKLDAAIDAALKETSRG